MGAAFALDGEAFADTQEARARVSEGCVPARELGVRLQAMPRPLSGVPLDPKLRG
jgi:hypothetical protein